VWHALDRKTLSLYNKSATLLVHGNGVGLKLHLDIPASTKQSLQIIHREGNLMLLLYLLMLFWEWWKNCLCTQPSINNSSLIATYSWIVREYPVGICRMNEVWDVAQKELVSRWYGEHETKCVYFSISSRW
jgi:hypothetical protein